jgi:hypothetical protein
MDTRRDGPHGAFWLDVGGNQLDYLDHGGDFAHGDDETPHV